MNHLHIKQHVRKIEFFPKISRQFKITFYFRPAVNQNKSISQSSKTSNSKSFHQFMSAKSIRAKSSPFIEIMSERSIVLSYKMLSIFDDISFTFALYFYKGQTLNRDFNFCSQWTRVHQVNQSKVAHYQECLDSESKRIFAGHYVGRQASNIPLMVLIKKNNLHTCRRCFRAFRFNNDLHGHLRCTHLEHRRRRSAERRPWRNF